MRCGNVSEGMWLLQSEPKEGRLLAQHRDLILLWKYLLAQHRDLGPLQLLPSLTGQAPLVAATHDSPSPFHNLKFTAAFPVNTAHWKLLEQHSLHTQRIYSVTYFSLVGELLNFFALYISPKLVQPDREGYHNFICDVVSQMDTPVGD